MKLETHGLPGVRWKNTDLWESRRGNEFLCLGRTDLGRSETDRRTDGTTMRGSRDRVRRDGSVDIFSDTKHMESIWKAYVHFF